MIQDYKPLPKAITTPDEIDSSHLGTLRFQNGYPTRETASKLADELDYLHGVEAFMNSIQGVSMYAMRKALQEIGVRDNDIVLFEKMMDAHSIFLTGNADTCYFFSFIDLSDGPMVVETPPGALGIFDDMWFHWIIDFGFPGPDRGQGGKYLLVPPGYDGLLPEGGYYVAHSRTNHVWFAGRAFLVDNDPKPANDLTKELTKIYAYKPGGLGTSIASYLDGNAPLTGLATPPTQRFVDASGVSFNTVPPNDFGHYKLLDALVQLEPAEALDPEIAGQFAAIGIVKGEKFDPDPRMRKILEEAVAVGNAASRTLGMGAHPQDHFRYYGKDSAWWISLWKGGFLFQTPPPNITKDGKIDPFPNTGDRKYHSRTSFFYTATGITPAMIMRLINIGSQYLIANVDSDGKPFDGAKTYKLVLPPNIPQVKFWSMTLYDNHSRSMLQTPQKWPRAGSQSYPSPAAEANADGSMTLYFSPKQPEGVPRGNWIQTDPNRGFFQVLRFYFPTKAFFDKTWQPGETEEIK